jgi:V/A-type H+-transporting ATPase subunit F
MRFFLICDDADTLTGFRLAGVEGVLVSDRAEAEAELDRAIKTEDLAVLLVSETVADMCRERVDAMRVDVVRPLIAVVPGPDGKVKSRDSITRLITETIGAKL